MRKKILKSTFFLLALILLFLYWGKIFNFKDGDGIYSISNFYKEPPYSIDVMCFGSSHIFENINTGVLWSEYGIADYNLCGSIQPLWNSYYYMKEALKTQKPRVMVLDVYGVLQTDEYIDHSRIIKNTYGMKISKDKIDSKKASAPKEKWIDYILEYPTYHNRYSEIERADFVGHLGLANYEYWKGFGLNTATTAFTKPDHFQTNSIADLSPKVREYLMKIIQLSKENDIPLLLIKSPYMITIEEQKKYNAIKMFAEENDVPFINFNLFYEDIGLDFGTDYADTDHMNHLGNVKFTRYFANYLKENYDIPDRRGESVYHSYDLMAEDYWQRIYNFELQKIMDIGNFIDKAQNDHYITVYSITGDYKDMSNYPDVKEKLLTIGIDLDAVNDAAVWIIQNNEILFMGEAVRDFEWHIELGENNNLMVSSSDKSNAQIAVNLSNQVIYEPNVGGLHILVYDTCTETLVENVRFNLLGNTLSYEKQPIY